MNQAAYLKIINMAKKNTGMLKLAYEGDDGKATSTMLYLSKYPDSDTANRAVAIIKSRGKKPGVFLDHVSVGAGYLLVTLGKMLFTETSTDAYCISGVYSDKDGICRRGCIHRDRFGFFPDGKPVYHRTIPFERIIGVEF